MIVELALALATILGGESPEQFTASEADYSVGVLIGDDGIDESAIMADPAGVCGQHLRAVYVYAIGEGHAHDAALGFAQDAADACVDKCELGACPANLGGDL